ncbi:MULTISPECIES: VOC family protein [Halobellus]|uniref:VOC family protein n=1 Tax=Halobellus TaxID=1073986 RepID=UPI0021141C56|nr:MULTISPECIES: VOC family protein [Halobellus]MDQ2053845.1 VOC family protein [Halobellus sp. H-GB7]
MDVIHSAIWVSDIDETLDFYVGALGLEKTNEFVGGDDARNVYVRGESDAEIQFKHKPGHDLGEQSRARFDHLALEVDDTDAEVERLQEETETELLRGPLDSTGASARVAFITDPDGHVIELVEPREDL